MHNMWTPKIDTKEVKTFVNQSGETATLLLFKEHKELGNFYVFSENSSMPFQRKAILDVVIENEKIGLSKSEIEVFCNSIMENIKSNQLHDAYSYAKTLSERVKNEWSYMHSNALIAAAFILSENEEIGIFDQAQAEAKLEIWKKDKDLYAFFLRKAQLDIENLTSSFTKITQGVLMAEPEINVKTLAEKLNS